MPKTTQIGAKPVDNGQLGGNPSAPGLGWGTGNAGGMSWGNTGGADSDHQYRGSAPAAGGGIGWGNVSPAGVGSQIGLGSMGGLQGLLGALRGPQGTPGLGSINGGGLGASGYAGNDPRLGGVGGPGNAPASPTLEGADLGGPGGFGPGSSIASAFAARPGFSQGNRGAQKRMGGSSYAPRNAVDTNWDSPGGYSAPAAPPPPMPGITSDPGPAGGGLQSLLARARAMSPYGRG